MRPNEFAELNAFVMVAEERSFRRAAARLNLTPSTLSHAVRALEERLGVRLLNRTTRSVSATDAGLALLEQIAPALKRIEGAVEQVNVAASDTARVTRETEVSATQTRQTASHLSGLSSNLLDLVGTGNGRRP